MSNKLIYGIDYYIDEKGNMILTREYLLKQKRCCGHKCKHCPYKDKSK